MKSVANSPVMALNITTATFGNEEIRAIDARELHKQLGNKRKFADWIAQRIEQYGFIENEDFHKIVKPHQNNKTDYILTLDTAKEIAMVENNEQGRKIRKYLIAVEKEYRERILNPQPTQNSRLASQGFAIPNFALMNDDIGQFGLAVWQGLARVQEMMTEQNEQLILAKNLLAEQHEIINTLTEETEKLAEENYELKSNPLAMLTKSLQIATGREVNLSLGPTIGNLDNTHTTIKGFCAEHKIKLAQGDSIRFANILKKMAKKAGEKIPKIPDTRYGTLNIYPRYLLADAVKFL